MKSLSRSFACAQNSAKTSTDDLTRWARSVVKNPAAHYATQREAAVIRSLLLEVAR